ncbi:26s protease regulatory subunit 8, partial [Lasius niger]
MEKNARADPATHYHHHQSGAVDEEPCSGVERAGREERRGGAAGFPGPDIRQGCTAGAPRNHHLREEDARGPSGDDHPCRHRGAQFGRRADVAELRKGPGAGEDFAPATWVHAPPPQGTTGTPCRLCGSPVGFPLLVTPPTMPATSATPVTLMTATVTIATCGSPVMSTGVSAKRRSTPLRRSSLPTIPEIASPCAVARMRPAERIPTPSAGEERQHQHEATVLISSDSDGDSPGGLWRTQLERKARRRLSDGSSGDECPAVAGPRATTDPPPLTSANYPHLIKPCTVQLQRTLVRSISGVAVAGAAPRKIIAGGASDTRAEAVDAGRPSAPVSVREVMGRRRGVPATGGAGASDETPREVRSSGGGEHHRGPRRVEASGGRLAPAPVARQSRRQRVAARDALIGRAETVASIADLEEYAASVAAFFGEDAARVAGGDAPGARDRPVRS